MDNNSQDNSSGLGFPSASKTISKPNIANKQRLSLSLKLPSSRKQGAESAPTLSCSLDSEKTFLPTGVVNTYKKIIDGSYGFALVFDFDETITKKSLHGFLRRKWRDGDEEVVEKDIKEFLDDNPDEAFRNLKELRKIFKDAIDGGGCVAVASFSDYPEQMKKILQRFFPDISDNIGIYSGNRGSINGKTQHIECIKKDAKIVENTQIIFVDDDKTNCDIANASGVQAIHANIEDEHCDYLKDVRNLINQFTVAESQLNDVSISRESSLHVNMTL